MKRLCPRLSRRIINVGRPLLLSRLDRVGAQPCPSPNSFPLHLGSLCAGRGSLLSSGSRELNAEAERRLAERASGSPQWRAVKETTSRDVTELVCGLFYGHSRRARVAAAATTLRRSSGALEICSLVDCIIARSLARSLIDSAGQLYSGGCKLQWRCAGPRAGARVPLTLGPAPNLPKLNSNWPAPLWLPKQMHTITLSLSAPPNLLRPLARSPNKAR